MLLETDGLPRDCIIPAKLYFTKAWLVLSRKG